MINKATLLRTVRKVTELSYREAAACVDAVIDALAEGVSRGERVELRGLGSFTVRTTASKRTALLDGAVIPAHGRITFRPCQKLREAAWGCESPPVTKKEQS
jgi:nucleoid DNA-binding protein